MADRLDVTGRLDEGRQAVEHFETYVQACSALGFQHPDLSARQVRDCYDAESGLDLTVLDRDCATLRAAVNAVEEALWIQRTQVTELATGWRGSGADSAMRFLENHCDTGSQVAAHVRSAAENSTTLRDSLWQTVDSKVATTTAIDDRGVAEHAAWLAAAHTVTTGAAERSSAEALIHRQVIPYVDNDIRNDWLSAMHSAGASMATSYDVAIHALTSAPDPVFEIPGDLGPSRPSVSDEPVRATPVERTMPDFSLPADPVPTVPAAAPAAPSSTTPDSQPLSTDIPAESATPLGDMSGLSTGAGDLGGLGGAAGGLGGVIESIVDGIGSLIGSLSGGLGGSSGDPLLDDEPTDVDDVADPKDSDDDAEPVIADEPAIPDEPADQLTESPPAEVEAVDAPAAPPPIDPPPADEPPPAQSPPPDGSTPCEIAEDQLPQAGQ